MSLDLDENDIHKGDIDGDESLVSFTEQKLNKLYENTKIYETKIKDIDKINRNYCDKEERVKRNRLRNNNF